MWCGAVISLKAAARDYQKELNYQEAFKESYVAYASPGLSPEVETLLASAEVRGTRDYTVCVQCLRKLGRTHVRLGITAIRTWAGHAEGGDFAILLD